MHVQFPRIKAIVMHTRALEEVDIVWTRMGVIKGKGMLEGNDVILLSVSNKDGTINLLDTVNVGEVVAEDCAQESWQHDTEYRGERRGVEYQTSDRSSSSLSLLCQVA